MSWGKLMSIMRLSPALLIAFLLAGCASSGGVTPPPALQITTVSLPSANIGEIYAQQLTAVGGTAPYTWSLVSGSLPPGITLSSSGVLSGRPTASGQFQFEIEVSDSALGENNLKDNLKDNLKNKKSVIRIEWKNA